MATGMGLLVLRYLFLAALWGFVVLTLRQMIRYLPLPPTDRPGDRTRQRRAPDQDRQPPPAPGGTRRVLRPVRSRAKPSAQNAPKAELVVLDPGASGLKAGATVPLGDKAHIGRAPSNSVVVDDPHVSRAHAFIGRRGDAWILVDKGSSNGTYLNGRPVSRPVALRDGDLIVIGTVTFAFRLGRPRE